MTLVSKLQDENRQLRNDIECNRDLHNKLDPSSSIETISMIISLLLNTFLYFVRHYS